MKEVILSGESKDIVSENICKLREIFPDIFAEDKVDFDKLKSNLGEYVDDSHEKYNFTWPGKTQAIKESQKQSNGTLRPCKEESKNWDTTNNLYIEGDNLEVLKLLQKGYYNKIKCIYIDPPYNTGTDFVYKDDFKDNVENYLKVSGQMSESKTTNNNYKLVSNPETHGRFHSNWLTMMYPRLKLARNLLTDDGVIFISIDDNEVANLKKICDEIFDESNFISILKWKKKKQPSFLSKVAGVIEYILVYAKQYDNVHKLFGDKLADDDKPIINASNNISEKYFNPGVEVRSILNGVIPKGVYKNRSMSIEYLDDIIVKDGFTQNKFRAIAKFRSTQDNINEYVEDSLVFITSNNGLRRLLTDKEKSKRKSITDLILDWGQNQDGSAELKKLFEITSEVNIFDNPKPVELIKNLIGTNSHEDSTVLDFFSGSGTLAQSVMQLNAEENFNIKYILIQLDENTNEKSEAFKRGFKNICEIGKERIRRSGDKIVEESGNDELDIGFKVFKLDSSNLEKWDPDYNNIQQSLTIDQIKKDRTNEDLIYEIMLKYGIDLTLPIEEIDNIYSIGFGALIVCLSDNITKDSVNKILEISKGSSFSRVVFKDSGFASDADKTNIKEILKTNNINEFITI